MSLIRILHENEREKLYEHFMAMDNDGRYKRFCRAMNENAVRHYVDGIDFKKTSIFVIEDPSGDITGVGELFAQGEEAECAFSVLPKAQGRGFGHALMDRIVLHAKNGGVSKLSLMCLSDNKPMRKLASDAGINLKYVDGGDLEGYVKLDESTVSEHFEEIAEQTAAEIGHMTTESIRKTSEFVEMAANNWMSMLVPWKFAFNPAFVGAGGDISEKPKRGIHP